jgi:hypothetical protein
LDALLARWPGWALDALLARWPGWALDALLARWPAHITDASPLVASVTAPLQRTAIERVKAKL